MKDGKPEGEKVKKLIKEFEEFMELRAKKDDWTTMLYWFILWLYEERGYMIIPQDKCPSLISDVHLT